MTLVFMDDDLLALVSDDLRDSVAQCAAAAGYQLIAADVMSCGRAWRSSRAAIVDPSNMLALEEYSMPRRDRVVLVASAAESARVWRAGVELGVGAAFELPGDEAGLVRHLTESRMPRVAAGCAVAIVGGHGGAGATVLAAASALVAGARRHTLLVDANEVGAGIDLTLGVEAVDGLRWQDLTASTGQIASAALHDALPKASDRVSVLVARRDDPRPIAPAALSAVIDAGRAAGDIVIVDLPRVDVELTRAALAGVDVVVVVTGASVVAVAAARAVRTHLLGAMSAVEVAVRGPTLGGLRAHEVARAVDVRLLTAYRPDPRLPARLESAPLARLMRKPLRHAASDVVARAIRANGVAG
ncbi:septum site-determining protein Ssd [Gordonia sp. CPCC 205333]|uniref:septum site-determining protein Ssd n=1 Tax=Gordonia sp. CPCC 205333 TaxID=3140790 RepID=UPI003AF34E47